MKRCSVCKELLPDSAFSKTDKAGLQPACKRCRLYAVHKRKRKKNEIQELLNNWNV